LFQTAFLALSKHDDGLKVKEDLTLYRCFVLERFSSMIQKIASFLCLMLMMTAARLTVNRFILRPSETLFSDGLLIVCVLPRQNKRETTMPKRFDMMLRHKQSASESAIICV
jgi:hypothetical protein